MGNPNNVQLPNELEHGLNEGKRWRIRVCMQFSRQVWEGVPSFEMGSLREQALVQILILVFAVHSHPRNPYP